MALEDDTILAWDRNDEPLSGMFGAPLRLRCETGHGYKMIKWVRSVTLIRHYSEVGDGMGGTREDSGVPGCQRAHLTASRHSVRLTRGRPTCVRR